MARRPPKRHCADCGKDVYSWREFCRCDDCARKEREAERINIRELRARLRAVDEGSPFPSRQSTGI